MCIRKFVGSNLRQVLYNEKLKHFQLKMTLTKCPNLSSKLRNIESIRTGYTTHMESQENKRCNGKTQRKRTKNHVIHKL